MTQTIEPLVLIKSEGRYLLNERNVVAVLSVDSKSKLIKWHLENPNGEVLIESRGEASIYSRWRACFDHEDRFWFCSSDVGTSTAWPSNDGYELYSGSEKRDFIPDVLNRSETRK